MKLMVKCFFFFILCFLTGAVFSQVTLIYSQDFGTGTSFPAGWSAGGAHASNITVNTSSPSSGYTGSSGNSNITATGNNLFTWDHTGTLVAPNTPWVSNNKTTYKDSYIAICDAAGMPVTLTDQFDSSRGFRVNNVSGTTPVDSVYFPVGVNFNGPNRMLLYNTGTPDNFTVALGIGDVGNTPQARVNRIWYVNEGTQSGSKTTMKLFFKKYDDPSGFLITQDEVETGFNYTDTRLIQKDYTEKFVNVSNVGDVLFPAAGLYLDSSEIFAKYAEGISNDSSNVKNGITAFSRFSVVNATDIILPVTIINFRAYQSENNIAIDWTALNEVNISHYEIEKFLNGIDFSLIGLVPSKANQLNVSYHFIDVNPIAGDNFYRIKVYESDGTNYYTNIQKVIIGSATSQNIEVYPNPVTKESFIIQLNIPKGKYNLQLFDNSGKLILNEPIQDCEGFESKNINLPLNLDTGIYYLKLSNNIMEFKKEIFIANN